MRQPAEPRATLAAAMPSTAARPASAPSRLSPPAGGDRRDESSVPSAAANDSQRYELGRDHWAEVFTSPAAAERLAVDWDDLAADAVEPNVFNERWHLLPAWTTFGGLTHLVAVYRRGRSPADPPSLLGVFPTRIGRSDSRLLGTVAELWSHPYLFARTPLLRAGGVREAIDGWTRTIGQLPEAPSLAVWERMHAEGPAAVGLADWLRLCEQPSVVTKHYARAVCDPLEAGTATSEAYFERAISPKQRRELRRQQRRLTDLGEVAVHRPETPGEIDTFIEDFLRLEAAGWKGRTETAIAAEATHADYFRGIIVEAARRGQLDASTLRLDGRPVAVKLNLLARPRTGRRRVGFACKIGYDETLAKFSPGVQLELATIAHCHGEHAHTVEAATRRTEVPPSPESLRLDSCAMPDHPMIDRLWSERVLMQHRVFTLPHASRLARGRLAVLGLRRWMRHRPMQPDDVLRGNV